MATQNENICRMKRAYYGLQLKVLAWLQKFRQENTANKAFTFYLGRDNQEVFLFPGYGTVPSRPKKEICVNVGKQDGALSVRLDFSTNDDYSEIKACKFFVRWSHPQKGINVFHKQFATDFGIKGNRNKNMGCIDIYPISKESKGISNDQSGSDVESILKRWLHDHYEEIVRKLKEQNLLLSVDEFEKALSDRIKDLQDRQVLAQEHDGYLYQLTESAFDNDDESSKKEEPTGITREQIEVMARSFVTEPKVSKSSKSATLAVVHGASKIVLKLRDERGGLCPGLCVGVAKADKLGKEKYLASLENIVLPVDFYRNPNQVISESKQGWTILFSKRGVDTIEQAYEDIVASSNGLESWRKMFKVLVDEVTRLTGKEVKLFGEYSSDKVGTTAESVNEYYPPKNVILFGPPGTGKTYHTVIRAVEIIEGKAKDQSDVEEKEIYEKAKKRYDELKHDGRIQMVTFHQAYGYEEFIGGIRPESNEKGEISYPVRPGVFVAFCKKAKEDFNKKYVFIIDEINRGNVAKIFGELITLLEENKRLGAKEETTVAIPGFEKDSIDEKFEYERCFAVPQNVYIIGTMNTADRSLAKLDVALRRRFVFEEMMPKSELLPENIEGVNLNRMLKVMNLRIQFLVDREHQIGHAWLMGVKDIKSLGLVFRQKIIPLLQEYFYDDYSKIRKVLNDDKKEDEALAFFKEISKPELGAGWLDDVDDVDARYELNEKAFDNLESYRLIYET